LLLDGGLPTLLSSTLGGEKTLLQKYTTDFVLSASACGRIQSPAGYLLSSFDRFGTYDAIQNSEGSNRPHVGWCTANTLTSFGGYLFSLSFGGIITADGSGSTAMGICGVSLGQAGSILFCNVKFFCLEMAP
jgi:hypothetical protein